MEDLLGRLRRVLVGLVDRLPAAVVGQPGAEDHAPEVGEDQALGEDRRGLAERRAAGHRHEGHHQAEDPVEVRGGEGADLRAVPVVHLGADHGQGRLALDQRGEGQRAVVVGLDGLLHLVEVVVLVGQGVGQLVGDDGLVLVLVEARLLAPRSDSRKPGFFGLGGGLLDQVHGLGLGVVEGGDLLGVDPDHRSPSSSSRGG